MQSGLRVVGWLMVIVGAVMAAFGAAVFAIDTVAVIALLFAGASPLPDPASLALAVAGVCVFLLGRSLARVTR